MSRDPLKERLKKKWDDIYQAKKIKKGLSTDKDYKPHRFFNRNLKEWLFSCQDRGHIPNKDEVDEILPKLFDGAIANKMMGGIDSERLSYANVDAALMQMTHLPIQTDHDENGEYYDYPYLKVYGIISGERLTKIEKNEIETCFNITYDDDNGAYVLLIMSIPMGRFIDEEKQELINEYCTRFTRKKYCDYVKKTVKKDTGFKYPLKLRILDYFLDTGI